MLGDFQVVLCHAGGMLGVEAFQAIHTRADQIGNDFIGPVQSRMCHDCQAARLMNEIDGFKGGDFEFRHPGGLAFS